MDSHSVMTPEEYEAISGHPAPGHVVAKRRAFRRVSLSGCSEGSGVYGVTVECSPASARRVGDWLARVAERNGWGGTVSSS